MSVPAHNRRRNCQIWSESPKRYERYQCQNGRTRHVCGEIGRHGPIPSDSGLCHEPIGDEPSLHFAELAILRRHEKYAYRCSDLSFFRPVLNIPNADIRQKQCQDWQPYPARLTKPYRKLLDSECYFVTRRDGFSGHAPCDQT